MKILLINIDSKIPNLALMKISAFHKQKGDDVTLYNTDNPDVVYASVVFSKNKHLVDGLKFYYPKAKIIIGGYGFCDAQLPQEIEHTMPDYSIFNCNHSYGFTTRGCFRNCWFCIVPRVEGEIRINSPVEEFHNPDHDTVELLDNNILYFDDWFMKNTDYLIKHDLKVIENGIDIRLVNKKNAERLHELNMKSDRLHFAFDDLSYEKEVRRGIEILEEAGFKPRYLMCYVLAWPGGFEDVWKRLEIIWKEYSIDPFVQIYNNSRKDKRIRKLARWCNKPQLRKTCEFSEYRRRDLISGLHPLNQCMSFF